MLLALSLSLVLLAAGVNADVPAQWFYSQQNVASVSQSHGCTVTRWNGTDPNGNAGYPWLATIDCPEGSTYHNSGVSDAGMLRFYLRSGQMEVNKEQVSGQGSSYWVSQGVEVSLTVTGSVYVVGGPFELSRDARPARFTSSFGADPSRVYRVSDALHNTNSASNKHDPHINNGTTDVSIEAARDLTWSSKSGVDPPSIIVLNCAPGDSYVLPHSHPAGALYIPFTGRICFQTSETKCTDAGYARWTSPNLYYYETFVKVQQHNEATVEAESLVARAGITKCEDPIVFAVTNFDPDTSFGQPNFVDSPKVVRPGDQNFSWGVFENLAVRTTTVMSQTVRLEA